MTWMVFHKYVVIIKIVLKMAIKVTATKVNKLSTITPN